jgi:hypothetical protein
MRTNILLLDGFVSICVVFLQTFCSIDHRTMSIYQAYTSLTPYPVGRLLRRPAGLFQRLPARRFRNRRTGQRVSVSALAFVALLVCASTIFAQTQANVSLSTNANITTNASVQSSGASLKALLAEKRVIATAASVPLFTPLRAHGRLFMTATEAFITIRKNDIQWLDYNGMAEIFAAKLPTFPLSLGYQGAFNHISVLGASARDVAVMMNGRPTNDIALGAAHIEHLPPEMMQEAEVYLGSDAVLLANNAAGAAINLQEIRHDTKNFYVRAWYHQANEQYTAADVDVSQNIAPNLNLTVGARTQFGNRIYNNTGVSAWNARTILRWNVSSMANVSLSYLLTQQRVALSGGVTSATVFDFNTSATVFNETRENTFRHDLTLTASSFLTRDSAVAVSLTGYATLNERNIERSSLQGTTLSGLRGGGNLFGGRDTLIAESTSQSISIGATGRVETRVTLFNALEAALTAGGNVSLSNVESSVYWDAALREQAFTNLVRSPRGTRSWHNELTGFGRLAFNLQENVQVSGGARIGVVDSLPVLNLGAKISAMLVRTSTTTLEVWGDASRSVRTPTIAERGMNHISLSSASTLSSEIHTLILGGLRLRERTPTSEFSCDVVVGSRGIASPIIATQATVGRFLQSTRNTVSQTNRLMTVQTFNGADRTILTASVTADWHLQNAFLGGNVVFSGFAQGSLPLALFNSGGALETVQERIPLLYAGCTAQYEYIVGRSILRAGVRVRMNTAFQPQGFVPTTWSYIEPSFLQDDITQGLAGNGLDVVVSARVGNAYIRATYQNVLNTPTRTVGLYPQYPSNVRVSLALTILE